MMNEESLPRRFGPWTGGLVTVASMVGVGILTTSGYTIQATESPSTLLLLWTLGGLLSLCGALTYAEMATMLPRAGGDYVFVREAYGDAIGFTYGWATFLLGFAAPTALIAHACIVYLLAPWRTTLFLADGGPDWIAPAGASLVIFFLTVLHCRGQRSSAWVQNATTLFKFVLLSVFVIAGLTVSDDWSRLTAGRSLRQQDFGVALLSLVYVFYAYLGWNASVYLAGEIEEPARSLPRAIVGGCLVVTILYLALNLTFVLGIGPYGLQDAGGAEVEAVAETAGRHLFGERISNVLSILIGCGIFASVSAYILTGSRIAYAMAGDGLFPSFAGHLSPRFETPVHAIATLSVSAILLLWGSHLIAGAADAFRELLSFTTVGLVLLTSLAVTALFVLRRRGLRTPEFRVPFYPLPPIVFLALTSLLMVYAIQRSPIPTLCGTATVLSGWPVYVVVTTWRR